MGFLITGSKFNTSQGEFDCLYGRIDGYSYLRYYGTLNAMVVLYTLDEKQSGNVEFPIDFLKKSNVVGVELEKDGEVINYPLSISMPVSSSVMVNVPIYHNHITSQSVNYYDFDDNGDVVEKTKLEYVSQSLIVGTQEVQQNILDTEVLTGNVFPFMYNVVTEKYKEIFGEQNIINF
jgi:hypothetical protein